MFKFLFQFSLAAIFLVSVNSCCTKIDCEGFDHINEIAMWNFTADEVDSIAFEIFPRGSNFTQRIDSSFRSAHSRTAMDKDMIFFMPENILTDHEYRITLLSAGTGQTYTLSNFTKTEEACNKCQPLGTKRDYYDALESYELNGQKRSGNSIIILK